MPEISPVSMRAYKTELFEQFARVAKALSSGVRLEVLDLLAQKDWSVDALAETLGQSLQNMSQHLQVLRNAKLVHTRKDGTFVYYSLAGNDVSDLVSRLQSVSHRVLSEVDEVLERFRSHLGEFEVIGAAELLERARTGEVVVLDVRPPGEFENGHLPYAQNIPLMQLEARLGELPSGVPVVAYCRGRYCLLAYAAVDLLLNKGFKAERLATGLIEWKLQAGPLEQGGVK